MQGQDPTSNNRHLAARDDDTDEIDLLELAGTLWRGKWIILACSLLSAAMGGYYAYRMAIPMYSAGTSIAIDTSGPQIVDIENVFSGVSSDWYSLNTEVGKISSRRLGEQVVRRLDLTENPDFNPYLATSSDDDTSGWLSNLLQTDEIEEVPPTETEIFNATVDSALGAITVNRDPDSYIFTITATTGDRGTSVLLANTHADAYIADQIAIKFEAIERAVTWLTERVTELESELQRQEDGIKDLRAQSSLSSPEALQAINQQANDMEDRLKELRSLADEAEAKIARLEALRDDGDFESMARAFSDPVLQQLYQRLETGGEEAKELFESRFSLLLEREASDRRRASTQAEALEASYANLQNEIAAKTQDLIELQQAEREVEATRVLYETFLTRLKETTVQRGLQEADALVLSPAIAARKVAPRERRILALSIILGIMAGAGLVLLQSLLHRGFRTAEDLEKYTGLTVLGQIPRIPISRRAELIPYLKAKPTSAASEAIRNLRTSVLLSNIDTPPEVIMCTSSLPGEGKTTQAIALAHNFAGLGKKVLLLEGDIRRRTFSQYLDNAPEKGLISALSGETPLEDVTFHDDALGADVLIGEKSNVNAADIFSSDRFDQFLTYVRSVYDVIIIDSPPVLVVPDARVVGQSVDAILYVVKWEKTTKSQVEAGLRQLETANLRIAGFSLSQIDTKAMQKYGYGKKYGAYGAATVEAGKYYEN
ncbi:capsular exopolysaccharide synthesis family protein [Marivita geojedonensis]|nr:capsular exopolysaccharide synthesis family protein [Marivita geojedonensis]